MKRNGIKFRRFVTDIRTYLHCDCINANSPYANDQALGELLVTIIRHEAEFRSVGQ